MPGALALRGRRTAARADMKAGAGRLAFRESGGCAWGAGMPHAPFVPLRIFSSFTMLDGAIEPKKIAARARELGFPAAAITDRNGLYGSMAFSDACKGAGVQPIIGGMLCVARPDLPDNVES